MEWRTRAIDNRLTGFQPSPMIDIHSHILPGWDDGSRSIEESLAMLRIAVDSGTTDIVATPHANSQFRYQPDQIKKLYAELQQAANGMIYIHLGSDFHVLFENVQDALEHPRKYTINGGPYLMVELPDIMNLSVMREILARLRGAGIIPVITHPERNIQLQSNLDELRLWVAEDCLLQVTGQSLLGRFGRTAQHFAVQLLKEDLVHFIASDAHDTQDRTPKLDEAYRWIESKYGHDRAERLFLLNPGAVIRAEAIEVPELLYDSPRRKSWWQVWK